MKFREYATKLLPKCYQEFEAKLFVKVILALSLIYFMEVVMDKLIDAIADLIGTLVTVGLVGGGLALFAGEIRLAALKKASQGSTKLSTFTEKMTKTKIINHRK